MWGWGQLNLRNFMGTKNMLNRIIKIKVMLTCALRAHVKH